MKFYYNPQSRAAVAKWMLDECGAKPEVVLVDLQNDFCDPKGVMGSKGEGLEAIRSILPGVQQLLANAREAGVMVVHVKAEYGGANQDQKEDDQTVVTDGDEEWLRQVDCRGDDRDQDQRESDGG